MTRLEIAVHLMSAAVGRLDRFGDGALPQQAIAEAFDLAEMVLTEEERRKSQPPQEKPK